MVPVNGPITPDRLPEIMSSDIDEVTVTADAALPEQTRGETIFRELLDDEAVTIHRVTLPPGTTEAAHFHDAPTYIYHLSGTARVRFDGADGERELELTAGELLTIPAYVVHEPRAVSDEPVETLAIRAGSDVETVYV